MKVSPALSKRRFHHDAYRFVFEALKFTQEEMRQPVDESDEESLHVTGPELLAGIRELGLRRFGLLARDVFAYWGIKSTRDFGCVVFELIERGEMRKTDDDQLEDFDDVYCFGVVLDAEYQIPTTVSP